MNPYAHPTFPAESARLYRLASYSVDYASKIDTEEEILAEEIGVTPAQAAAMLEWVRNNKKEEDLRNDGDLIAKMFSLTIPAKKEKINLQILGLRFLALYWLLNSSGESLTSLAARTKIHRSNPTAPSSVSKQLLDWHANNLGRKLNFHGYQQKASKSRESYSNAQKDNWASLSQDERRQRRAGKGKKPKPKPIANKADLIRAKMLELSRNNSCKA